MPGDVVLVSGATGRVGSALVAELCAAGAAVRAMSRRPGAPVPGDVELVVADLAEPSSLPPALEGVGQAFLMAPVLEMSGYVAAFCDAARRADVRRVVLLSSASVEMDGADPISQGHRAGERLVAASGLAFTFLRPAIFHSTSLAWARSIISDGVVRSVLGDCPAATIDQKDIAAVACQALLSDRHDGKVYSLTGPETLRPSEQAAILSDLLGRRLGFEPLDEADGARALSLAYGDAAVAVRRMLCSPGASWVRPNATVLELTGRPARSFRHWASEHLAAFESSAHPYGALRSGTKR